MASYASEYKQRILDRLVSMITSRNQVITEVMVQRATDMENLSWHNDRIGHHKECIAQIEARQNDQMMQMQMQMQMNVQEASTVELPSN